MGVCIFRDSPVRAAAMLSAGIYSAAWTGRERSVSRLMVIGTPCCGILNVTDEE